MQGRNMFLGKIISVHNYNKATRIVVTKKKIKTCLLIIALETELKCKINQF